MAEHPLHRQTILGAMGALIVGHLIVRGWAIYPSWFYNDDYRLLYDASTTPFDLAYLVRPFDSQFMPVGRAIASLVAHAGLAEWSVAASVTWALQLVAAISCAWMLITLFGTRWLSVLLLSIYLTSAMTLPSYMWWAASLNQVPLQVVLFASVAAWVHYARSRRLRWLAATAALLMFGLLCYVKTLLVLPVLGYLLLAYFAEGSLRHRLRHVIGQWWQGITALTVVATGYLTYYLNQVPQVFVEGSKPVAGDLADAMLGTSFPVGVLGGPWRWNTSNPPVGYADPPNWAVHVAWVVLVSAVVSCALLRTRTLRAAFLVGAYVSMNFGLVLASRAQVVGSDAGLEYRYLSDTAGVAILAAGLALMPVTGAVESSACRAKPMLQVPWHRRYGFAAAALVCVSGLASSISYARIWHTDNPGQQYAENAIVSMGDQGPIDLADQVVPATVIAPFVPHYNTTSHLIPLLVPHAQFPEVTSRLVVLDEEGRAAQALIKDPVRSPPGPVEDCGWLVAEEPQTIPLTQPTLDYEWWVRVGYLASANTTLRIKAGGTVEDVPIKRGLHSVFLQVTGVVDELRITPTGSAVTCVDVAEVGVPTVGPPL